MLYTFEQVEKTLNRIQKNHPEIGEVITFYKEIVKEQLKVKENIQLPSIDLAEEKTRGKFQKGFPLLELNLIPVSLKAYKTLAEELANLLKKRGPSVTAEMEKIRKDILRDSNIFISLAQNYLLHNWAPIYDLSQDHNLDTALLFFFIKSSVKPFAESLAEEIISNCNLPPWSEASCPICGSLPSLAYLKPARSYVDGHGQLLPSHEEVPRQALKRFLVCSLCNYCWSFPRLKCPFCRTERQGALRYFCIDSNEKGIRVDVCNDCKGYIKTIDYEYEQIAEEVLFLEDLDTIYLDLVAEKEGYCKKAKGIFSL
jgi:FdhE protein